MSTSSLIYKHSRPMGVTTLDAAIPASVGPTTLEHMAAALAPAPRRRIAKKKTATKKKTTKKTATKKKTTAKKTKRCAAGSHKSKTGKSCVKN